MVVPVYRNGATLAELADRVSAAAATAGKSAELIFIDDRSPDDAWDRITALARSKAGIRGLRVPQNGGQHTAALLGLSEATGAWCVVMDADLQDPPEAVPLLLASADEHDVVFAGRRGRYQGGMRLVTGQLYRWLVSVLVGVPRDAAICFALRRSAVERLLDLRVSQVSLVAMIGLAGCTSVSMPVTRQRNESRESSYSARRRIAAGVRMLKCVLQARLGTVREPIRTRIAALRRASETVEG